MSTPLFEILGVAPLVYERLIDELAARGFQLEDAFEATSVCALAESLYDGIDVSVAVVSVRSLDQKHLAVLDVVRRLKAMESGYRYGIEVAINALFNREDVLEAEARICEAYGIQPGQLVRLLIMVRRTANAVLGVYEGEIVCPATMSRLSSKQAVNAVLNRFREVCGELGYAVEFARRFVEDALALWGILAIIRKQAEVRSLVASPARAIEQGDYVVEVRYADEIADAYRECADDGHIFSCMAKNMEVADGLTMQYGSLHGVHSVVVIYKTTPEMACLRRPVARFLVERAVCVRCGTAHTVISRRYTDGAAFSMAVAEFVAESIASHTENSVLVGVDPIACRTCSAALMTVLDVPVGLDRPIWCDWGSDALVVEGENASDLIELRFSGRAGLDPATASRLRTQELSGYHMEDPVSMQDEDEGSEVRRLYELARTLARTEEPPISNGRLTLMIGDAIRSARR